MAPEPESLNERQTEKSHGDSESASRPATGEQEASASGKAEVEEHGGYLVRMRPWPEADGIGANESLEDIHVCRQA